VLIMAIVLSPLAAFLLLYDLSRSTLGDRVGRLRGYLLPRLGPRLVLRLHICIECRRAATHAVE